jgi:NAD(P) transhydrogenase subunit beta
VPLLLISDPDVVGLLYLVAIVCFILALRFLSSPKHARRGNWIGGVGMLVAIGTTLALDGIGNWGLLALGAAIGAAIGLVGARTVKMTAMPQMVALFNGVGGGAAALIAFSEFHVTGGDVTNDEIVSIVLSSLIGSVSFAGSMVAFAKLQELLSGRPIVFKGQNVVDSVILLGAVGLGIALVAGLDEQWALVALILLALLFGVMFVLPIGGADMPVVISLLNAFTGLAASATGFVLDSTVLIVAGMLVGASGTLLTLMMAKAMNRSVANVVFGAFGQVQAGTAGARVDDGRTVRSTTPEDVAVQLSFARKVVVVPGYGMAVAQAQHDVRQLAEVLEDRGVDVAYAIHPVAGRMPGHMNVLLAEANVPYDQLKEMNEINPEFAQTDVALVIGANDVTNPAARSDSSSPIYGMPILDVDKAASVVVMKRSMNPGFAGIDNELYLDPRTTMLFGDAKDSVVKLIGAVKAQ